MNPLYEDGIENENENITFIDETKKIHHYTLKPS
jgi:hypothetical protein